jgi:hypothetical protein
MRTASRVRGSAVVAGVHEKPALLRMAALTSLVRVH